ncbi:MAG: protein-L-isoaspartate(D-aspartate) O-methyltransferase [Candidatus Palauibacterales bacterium]|nr:protein-L-isoaspartate(D-aspartate) O-methyltransferase [Candidatus Palauibacterales bacterium]
MSFLDGFFSTGGQRGGGADDAARRRRMVERQIRRRGVDDERVLSAMEEVPRHLFVRAGDRSRAYQDSALPIGHDQTISQPYIVARMTELLEPDEGLTALEVGTGSGYQAAVLAACGIEVFSVERIAPLSERAREALLQAGYADRVHLRVGDGSLGWPEEAPFDRIVVTAGAAELPDPLREQLADGGVAVAPVGGRSTQWIRRYRRQGDRWEEEEFEAARFVPLIRGDEEEGR